MQFPLQHWLEVRLDHSGPLMAVLMKGPPYGGNGFRNALTVLCGQATLVDALTLLVSGGL